MSFCVKCTLCTYLSVNMLQFLCGWQLWNSSFMSHAAGNYAGRASIRSPVGVSDKWMLARVTILCAHRKRVGFPLKGV